MLSALLILGVVVPWAVAGESLVPLQVAYAGSMGSLMELAVKPAVATALGVDLRGRAQGSTALAHLIAAGAIRPDVFISVTPEPMRIVLKAGKTERAIPFARTEVVIAYSPRSRYASLFAAAHTSGGPAWWQLLETPGLRFGRTNPQTDPQGLSILFTMQLAQIFYRRPDLSAKILGSQLNPRQIFQEAQVMARLQAGQLDASAAYRTQPAAFGLPFLTLPPQVNLGDASLQQYYRQAAVDLNGKTLHPSPLVFYVASLKDAPQPVLAARFVAWLQGPKARSLLRKYDYDPPEGAQPLVP